MRVRRIFERSDLTIVAVERVTLTRSRSKTGCLLQGKIEPTAVVVCAGDHTFALDIEAQALDLEQLQREVAGLDSIIRQ